ncbi:MAG: DNA gyrase inhibitor YacG [Nitrospiraceae bacterium]|nr:DNA gyrase inhibitor YacG [Nitrospiraceae bacterium]
MSQKKITCPVCKKKTEWEGNPWRPFCSERCKTIDLASWASGEYRIAGEKKTDEEDESTNGTDGGLDEN